MYCMIGFGRSAASRLKEITSDQDKRWDFRNFFVPFGLPKTIVVDSDELFDGITKNKF